ncbi:phytochrome family protein [Leeuwenhoekiella palythoae]|uniref:histidine kinase n=1 Tax=Leeuwenhoekiella palythoae TaxID=573501 RepID=A0A1M5WW59_9FLAO|nr:HAMP domain-containing histidine kinase [Leeuwenhoekiella palythoae]RXG31561.1 hypothetical protein DSM01_707 [Leeuwenhoekiella palythoae]SHH91876.1 hypothetical protein SAMN04487999_1415 [Leeuwenhoekiella palythoae]
MNLSGAKYRITYEAFSKFSGNLSKVESLEELGKIISRHLKYLFNYKVFKIMILHEQSLAGYTFLPGKTITHTQQQDLEPYERLLLKDKIPFVNSIDSTELPEYLKDVKLNNGNLWGWFLAYSEYQICISLVSDDDTYFSSSDVDIVHLLADSVASKYRQISLSEILQQNNIHLESLVTEIACKNKEIKAINDNQQLVIEARTEELLQKNKKLFELSRLNAHDLREPLSRVLGLLELAEHLPQDELRSSILPKIKEASGHLDQVIQRVVTQSEKELINIKSSQP